MNRILRGAVVLAASALAWGCNTEPDALTGGDPDHIVADPGKIVIEQGDSVAVLIRLVDQQGTSLEDPITFSNIDAGVSISIDSLYRPVFNADGSLVANPNNTELRVFVRGDALTAGSFTITSADKTLEVPVTILPTGSIFDATLSDLTPDIGEVVTITAPTGFIFNTTSTVTFATGDDPTGVTVAADGSTISFIPMPGSSGAISVTDVTPSYAPALKIPLTLSSEIALTTVSLYSSDDPTTAPSIPVPANIGDVVVVFDQSVAVDQFTHIVITEPNTTLDISVDWDNDADIDFWLCDADCTNPGTPGGFTGASSAQPENDVVTFVTPGTYTIQTDLYDGSQPTWRSIQLIRVPTPP